MRSTGVHLWTPLTQVDWSSREGAAGGPFKHPHRSARRHVTHFCSAVVVSRAHRGRARAALGLLRDPQEGVVAERTGGAFGKAWARAVWQRDSAVLPVGKKATRTRQKQQHTQQARTHDSKE